eukprot:gene16764-biopygen763
MVYSDCYKVKVECDILRGRGGGTMIIWWCSMGVAGGATVRFSLCLVASAHPFGCRLWLPPIHVGIGVVILDACRVHAGSMQGCGSMQGPCRVDAWWCRLSMEDACFVSDGVRFTSGSMPGHEGSCRLVSGHAGRMQWPCRVMWGSSQLPCK